MRYLPEFTSEEIMDNHILFRSRNDLYKEKGLDFMGNRKFIFEKIGSLDGDILEIGSGKGVTAVFLTKKGYRIVSIDKNDKMLKIAALNLAYEKLLAKTDLHVMDAYFLDFEREHFNNIFIIEALHHIDNIDGLFAEADKVLAKNGRLILADFNEKGMGIVNKVHESEGNVHENSFVGSEDAKKWLSGHDYNVKSYDDNCHWVLISEKR